MRWDQPLQQIRSIWIPNPRFASVRNWPPPFFPPLFIDMPTSPSTEDVSQWKMYLYFLVGCYYIHIKLIKLILCLLNLSNQFSCTYRSGWVKRKCYFTFSATFAKLSRLLHSSIYFQYLLLASWQRFNQHVLSIFILFSSFSQYVSRKTSLRLNQFTALVLSKLKKTTSLSFCLYKRISPLFSATVNQVIEFPSRK